MGFLSEQPQGTSPRIWLHAASVGEVQAAKVLLSLLKEQLPEAVFIVSTMTEQGQLVARRQLGATALCIYAPLDLPCAVKRTIRAIEPSLYMCLETELWPNLMRHLRRKGVKLVLLNGRLSERSFRRYRKIQGLLRETLACFDGISAIQAGDAERFISLGARQSMVAVNGNAKYDSTLPRAEETRVCYRQRLGLREGQPVFLAGSTHDGEESILLGVFRELKETMPELVFIIGPRHLERLAEIESLLRAEGESFDRLSLLDREPRRTDTILIDTMGELADIYSIATYVFCGGSLVPRGGHNVMEAAAWAKPVFYGPHMKDFADAKELLESVGAGFQVRSAAALTEAIRHLAVHPELYEKSAREAAEIAGRQHGSARQQVQLALQVLKN